MQERSVLGLVEPVKLGDVEILARIDTGAERSSISQSLVDELGFELEEDTRKIRSAHGITRRFLVKLNICIEDICLQSLFTVSDRSQMKYKLLIGQDILKQGHFLIDPLKEE